MINYRPLANDQVVLIAGGGRGIGFGIDEATIAVGYNVIVSGAIEQELYAVSKHGALLTLQLGKKLVNDNLTAAIHICLVAHRTLAASIGGFIIHAASLLSLFGGLLTAAYSDVKGLVQLTKSISIAWIDQKIGVNRFAAGCMKAELILASLLAQECPLVGTIRQCETKGSST